MNDRVRYINTDIFKGVYQPIRTKNAYAIGFIGKSSYIVTLEKDDENKISSSTLRDFLISVKDGSLRMELNN